MRPPFNSFQPQQQQNNGYHQHQHQHHHNGYQNQLGLMMNNPPMIPMPNMPIQPHFFFNNNMHQLHQFGLPNQFLPNLNLNFFRPPPLGPCAFSPLSYPPVPNQQLRPPEPRPQAGNFNNVNGSNTKGNYFPNKHQKRFQSSQLHASKQKSGFNKEHNGKRKMSTSHDGSGVDSIAKEKKRPYVCFYTPKEIQLWRQARRRNFPTKHNIILKKSKKNVSEEEAKLRRQQLQEVVAKQAELGVEVAQVPSHYLSGTQEQQANGNRGDNNGQALNDKPDGRRGRSQNNKTRHGEKEKPRSEDQNSSQESSSITLLEKPLSADMKRDKSRLLQVLRFMVMNSFFKDQLPLKLPLVMVEEHVREDEVGVDMNMNGDDNSAVER